MPALYESPRAAQTRWRAGAGAAVRPAAMVPVGALTTVACAGDEEVEEIDEIDEIDDDVDVVAAAAVLVSAADAVVAVALTVRVAAEVPPTVEHELARAARPTTAIDVRTSLTPLSLAGLIPVPPTLPA